MKDKTSLILMACVLVIPCTYAFFATVYDFSLGDFLQAINLP